MHNEILFAGFGGQGILFSGKLFAYIGMLSEQETSWLPSYGPEMRGGTANCSVIISDDPIGSPLVLQPTELMVMNAPSLDKFEQAVKVGGKIFVDSSIISRPGVRSDVDYFYVPATKLAMENGMTKLANVIMIGKMLREMQVADAALVEKVIRKNVPASKPELFDLNMKAIKLGYDF